MIDTPHAASPVDVVRAPDTDAERGLTGDEARVRLERFGRNEPSRQRRPPYARLARHRRLDPLVALLVGAAAVSIAIGDATASLGPGAAAATVLLALVPLGAVELWKACRRPHVVVEAPHVRPAR